MIRNVMCLMCLRFQRGRSVDQDIIGEQCIRNDHGVLAAHLIDKDMVREPSSKMKNGKDVGQSGVVSEMVKAAGEAGVDMIRDLVNQITLYFYISNWNQASALKFSRLLGLKLA